MNFVQIIAFSKQIFVWSLSFDLVLRLVRSCSLELNVLVGVGAALKVESVLLLRLNVVFVQVSASTPDRHEQLDVCVNLPHSVALVVDLAVGLLDLLS